MTGPGGAEDPASIWKFDRDLNLLASADTGQNTLGIVLDWDGNIAVYTYSILTYTTDLEFVAEHEIVPVTHAIYGNELQRIPYMDDGTPAVPGVPGVEGVEAVPGHWETIDSGYMPNEVCVYADGTPLGVFDVNPADTNDILGLDESLYTTIIAGINYWSTYESFPLELGNETNIHNATIDFYESLGCNVGVSRADSEDWLFSEDEFATRLAMVTEIKDAPFYWGTKRDPVVHLWVWIPVPMTVRNIINKMEVEID